MRPLAETIGVKNPAAERFARCQYAYNGQMNLIGGTSRGITRRSWAALMGVAPVVAQVASTPQNPPPLSASSGGTQEQGLAKAAADVRKVSDRLAETEVPMTIEPAFCFRVV